MQKPSSSAHLVFCAALAWEARAVLASASGIRRIARSPFPVWQVACASAPTLVLRTGMGPERAARAAEWFLERFEAVALISAGCAGALAPGIERAAVVVPHLILRDVDLAPFLPDVGLQRGLVEAVHRAQLKPREGSLLTSGRPILNRKARQRAHVRSGAVAVDMESATIAAVARRFEIPFAGLRVILDPVPKQPIAPPLPWLLKSIPDVARHLTAITSAFLRADLPLP